jgi:hypothetical protein
VYLYRKSQRVRGLAVLKQVPPISSFTLTGPRIKILQGFNLASGLAGSTGRQTTLE